MSGSIKVGGNTIATHTGAQGAGEVALGTNLRLPASGGIQDSSGNNILTESGGNTTISNSAIKLKSSGDSITKSDGTTAVLSESGGVVTLNNGTIGSGVVFPALGNSAVGTVSESSGTPTGDIIERGSNSNGEYVKYADGTMICFLTSSSIGSAGYVFTFPATFSAVPAVSGSANNGRQTNNEVIGNHFGIEPPSVSGFVGYVMQNAAYNELGAARRSGTIHYIAIGRWY